MKMTISKRQWENIGKKMGWMKISKRGDSWVENFLYYEDQISGDIYGQTDKFYEIEIKGELLAQDDSDFNRETGYGKLITRKINNISDLKINEYDIDGNKYRDEVSIKRDDINLYNNLIKRAKSNILDDPKKYIV